jgi:hypothetical protein
MCEVRNVIGLCHPLRLLKAYWTSRRIQTETYGFARQKTRCWYTNLILISCMSFLVNFRPEMASERATRITRVILTPTLTPL